MKLIHLAPIAAVAMLAAPVYAGSMKDSKPAAAKHMKKAHMKKTTKTTTTSDSAPK